MISPDSRWIATGSEDRTIILWDANGQVREDRLISFEGIRCLAFSPDGRYLSCTARSREIMIWSLGQDTSQVATLKPTKFDFQNCAWSPDGTVLAATTDDNTLCLWHTDTFQLRHRTEGSGRPVIAPHFIVFSPDGRWLATSQEHQTCRI